MNIYHWSKYNYIPLHTDNLSFIATEMAAWHQSGLWSVNITVILICYQITGFNFVRESKVSQVALKTVTVGILIMIFFYCFSENV